MFIRNLSLLGGAAVVAVFLATPASALTMQECSAKYNAAKDANKLGGKNWNEFRKAECAADDAPAKAPAKAEKAPKADKAPAKADKAPAKAARETEAAGLTMQECSTKYNAAKDADALGGKNWNAFRKDECGPGASATFVAPRKAAPKATAAKPAAAETEAAGLSMQECSAKYQAAKDADALGGKNWNAFRKDDCGPGASATFVAPRKAAPKATAAKPAAAETEAAGLSMQECSAKYQAAKDADALGGKNWNAFRKDDCGPGASATFVAPRKAAPSLAAAPATGGLSMKECSARYQQAKADGSLGSLKWNDFRKQRCGSGADDDDAPSIDEASYDAEPERPVTRAPRGVVFPRAVSAKFRNETPAKQRMRTCLESYYDNKDNNTLSGLRWIQKGGGYYSLCNNRLKGES